MKKYILAFLLISQVLLVADEVSVDTNTTNTTDTNETQSVSPQHPQPPQDIIKILTQGTKRIESPYKDGVKNGVEKVFDESLRVDGIMPLKTTENAQDNPWYQDSNLLIRETTFDNGVKSGTEKSYYDNGQVKLKLEYLNGMLDGVAKGYNKDGSPQFEITYKRGKAVSGYKYTVTKTEMTIDDFYELDLGL